MSYIDRNDPQTTTEIFSDPVTYLAQFGVESELVTETVLPAAA